MDERILQLLQAKDEELVILGVRLLALQGIEYAYSFMRKYGEDKRSDASAFLDSYWLKSSRRRWREVFVVKCDKFTIYVGTGNLCMMSPGWEPERMRTINLETQ